MTGERFLYTALDPSGVRIKGELEAPSAAEVLALLKNQGLTPIGIRGGGARRTVRGGRLGSRDDLVELLFMLGQLLATGASLSDAMAVIRAQGLKRFATLICDRIEREISAGRPASEAFAAALGSDAGYIPALIAAGESSGDLAGALRGLADQLRSEAAMRRAFLGAVSYPLFIAAAATAACLMLLFVVVPSLTPLVGEIGGSASIPLKLLIGLSSVLRSHASWLGAGFVIACCATVILWRTGVLRNAFERFLLDGPGRRIFGSLMFGRMAAALGRMLGAGVPAPDAFRLAAGGVGVGLARERVRAAARAIYEGASVASALADCQGFPGSIARMAKVGEETGSLSEMLERAGSIEQAKALQAIESISKWLAPILIVALGAVIGGVMATLLTSVASLGSAVLN